MPGGTPVGIGGLLRLAGAPVERCEGGVETGRSGPPRTLVGAKGVACLVREGRDDAALARGIDLHAPLRVVVLQHHKPLRVRGEVGRRDVEADLDAQKPSPKALLVTPREVVAQPKLGHTVERATPAQQLARRHPNRSREALGARDGDLVARREAALTPPPDGGAGNLEPKESRQRPTLSSSSLEARASFAVSAAFAMAS